MENVVIVSSEILYRVLLKLGNALVVKPLVPVLEDFLFEIEGDVLTITASDLSTTLSNSIKLNRKYENMRIAIPGKILIETLKNLPDQPIKLDIDIEKNVIVILSNNGKYKIICDKADSFPVVKINKNIGNIVLDSKIFLDAIKNTIIVASSDVLKPAINSVLFEINDDKIVSVSTDIHRLIKYESVLKNKYEYVRFIIPKRGLILLNNIVENGEFYLFLDEKYAYIETENGVWISTLIKEQYPDFERVIPKNYTNKMTVNRVELLGSLKRLINYANGITFQVKFCLKNDNLMIVADDVNSENNGIENICCVYIGEELNIAFNVKYLLDIIQNIDSESVIFMFSNANPNKVSNNAAVIRPVFDEENNKTDDILALVMPIFM